jgi:catechol 2,3-dioxygenase
MKVQQIDHVAITVSDIERSIEWYTRVLGLEHRPVVEWGGYPQMVCAGETCLALFPAPKSAQPIPNEEKHQQLTVTHFAFRVDAENFALARERFQELALKSDFADHGVCHSLYINDPDGHRIEITTYEL